MNHERVTGISTATCPEHVVLFVGHHPQKVSWNHTVPDRIDPSARQVYAHDYQIGGFW